MSQKRSHSLIEICLGTAVKFGIAMLVWQFIAAPIFDYQTTVGTSFYITLIFTVNSLVIGYYIRRLFNWITYKHAKWAMRKRMQATTKNRLTELSKSESK